MMKVKLAATVLLIAGAVQHSDGHAQTISLAPMPEQHQDRAKGTDPASCRIPVHVTDEASKPFEIQLYVEFPENDEPELFTIRVP